MTFKSLAEVLDVLIDHRGKTPKKLGADYVPQGIPVISANNIKAGRLDLSEGVRHVGEELFARWMPEPLKPGDVLLTSEAPLGEVAYLNGQLGSRFCLGQRLFALRAKPEIMDNRYLYYWLASKVGQAELGARATGTTAQGIRQSELVKIKLPVPDLDEQQAAAAALGTIDDAIDTAQRIVRSSDRLVRALFAKCLLSTTAEASQRLGDIAEFTRGVSYRFAELAPSRTALITLKSFRRAGGYQPDGLKSYIGAYKPGQVVREGDVVVAQTDITQDAEVVGRAVRVPPDLNHDVLVNSLDCVIVRPKSGVRAAVLYGVLIQEDFRNHCVSLTSGTTVLHLASTALPSYRVPIFSQESQNEFASAAEPMLNYSDVSFVMAQRLERLRDELASAIFAGALRPVNAVRLG